MHTASFMWDRVVTWRHYVLSMTVLSLTLLRFMLLSALLISPPVLSDGCINSKALGKGPSELQCTPTESCHRFMQLVFVTACVTLYAVSCL